jgi:hypothetical protein
MITPNQLKKHRRRTVTLAGGMEIRLRAPSIRRVLSRHDLDPAAVKAMILAGKGLKDEPAAVIRARDADYYAFLLCLLCDAAVSPRLVLTEVEEADDAICVELLTDGEQDRLSAVITSMMGMVPGDLEVIAPFRDSTDAGETSGEVAHDAGSTGA